MFFFLNHFLPLQLESIIIIFSTNGNSSIIYITLKVR